MLRVALCLTLATACSAEGDGSGSSGGGGTSSATSSSTKAVTSSVSGTASQSTGTGEDLEAACARRVAPDCGDPIATSCWHLSGYSFASRTGACAVPDVDCSRATPIDLCVFFPPDQARWQQELLKQRQVGTEIEVLHVPFQSYGVLDDWVPCEQAPACPGWEYF